MNTKSVMTASAIVLGNAGVVLLFLPHEILGYLGHVAATRVEELIPQALGTLYFSFAMTNWTARANLIG